MNGPEIECKIKMQQINGCKSHLEAIIRNTSGPGEEAQRPLQAASAEDMGLSPGLLHKLTLLDGLQGH